MMQAVPAPILLAIDTCTRQCSIALQAGQRLRAESSWETDRHHTSDVAARIAALMTTAQIEGSAITHVAVALGPGSFTGVRCGLAIAQGFASAGQVGLVGIDAFSVLRAAQPILPSQGLPIISILEAGRKRVAVQIMRDATVDSTAQPQFSLLGFDEVLALPAPAYLCGEIPTELLAGLSARGPGIQLAPAWLNLRRAGVLAHMAMQRVALGAVDSAAQLAPIYPP